MRVPRVIYLWLYRSPIVFLVFAVSCFSIGLVVFAYSSSQVSDTRFPLRSPTHFLWQHRGVSTITTVLSAFTYMGVAVVLSWFAFARRRFIQRRDALHQLQRSSSMHVLADETPSRRPTMTSPTISFAGSGFPNSPTIEKLEPTTGGGALSSGAFFARDGDPNPSSSLTWAPNPAPQKEKGGYSHYPVRGAYDRFRSYARISKSQIDPRLDDDIAGQNPPGALSLEDAWIDETGIHHMSFSPNGKLLAICGGKTSSTTWEVDVSLLIPNRLAKKLTPSV